MLNVHFLQENVKHNHVVEPEKGAVEDIPYNSHDTVYGTYSNCSKKLPTGL